MPEQTARHDDLQPLSETQIAQREEYLAKLEKGHHSMWDMAEGTELSWEMKVSPELVIMYADGVEDYNPWYEAWPAGPGESPFGTAVTPPLFLPRWQSRFHRQARGVSEVGGVATAWRTEFIEPCPVGTTVRYRGRLTKKYIKRERQYVEREFIIEDAATGQVYCKHTAIAIAKYAKAKATGETKETKEE